MTRQRLIDAALDLIWSSSYNSVGILQICEKAETTKGSFYHFFKSKSELATVALEYHWTSIKSMFDGIFSPTKSPKEQIDAFCKYTIHSQLLHKKEDGFVSGCPFFSTGMDRAALDEPVLQTIDTIIEHQTAYFIRLVKEIGGPRFPNAESAKKDGETLFAYVQGILSMARVRNDVGLINESLKPGLLRLAGF